jgi:K+-sensing histidine kinase KdpD
VRMRGIYLRSLKGSLGVCCCVVTAVLLSVYLNDGENIRFVAPVISLQVVILVSVKWGRVVGLIGSLLSVVIFATFLFPPVGSFAIHDPAEAAMLLLLIAGSVCVAALVRRNFPDA